MSRPLLSLCMIVKDEEEQLGRCLGSVQGVTEEIIVVDTGSTDRTKEIAASYGARVLDYEWTHDFSAARNVSLEAATGEWILYLDADETLASGRETLAERLAQAGPEEVGFYLPLINFTGGASHQEAVTNPAFRLFRNHPAHRFERALHEQILGAVVAAQPAGRIDFLPVTIEHYGYLSPLVFGREKIQRNYLLAREEVKRHPRESFAWFNLGVEYSRLAQWPQALYCYKRSFLYAQSLAISFVHVVTKHLAMCLLNLRRYDEALQILDEAALAYPEFTDLPYLAGQVHWQSRNVEGALTCFARCVDMGEAPLKGFHISEEGVGTYKALYWLGECYRRQGQNGVALEHYRQAIETSVAQGRYFELPFRSFLQTLLDMEVSLDAAVAGLRGIVDISTDARLTKMVARIFLESRRPEMAARLLLDLASPDAEARLILGSSLMLLNQPEAAQEAFRDALRLDPQQGLARLRYSLLLALQGHSAQAFRQLQKLPPELCEPELRQLYETLFQWWSRFPAQSARRKAQSADARPQAPCDDRLTCPWAGSLPEPMARLLQRHVLEILALLLRLEEFTRFEAALPLLEAVGMSPEDQWQCLGQLYYELHFEESSLAELLKLVDAGRATSSTYKMMGMICMRRQQYEEAEIFFREALRNDPSPQPNRACLLALTSALVAQGKRQEAEELINFISFMSAETLTVASGSVPVG